METTVVNSFEKWKTLTLDAIDTLASIDDCNILRLKIISTEINQFSDIEEAAAHKGFVLDKIDKIIRNLKNKEAYQAEQAEDIADMEALMNAGGMGFIEHAAESAKIGAVIDIPDVTTGADYNKLLSVATLINNSPTPEYSDPEYQIAHEGLMTIISTTIDVYVRRMKYYEQLNK